MTNRWVCRCRETDYVEVEPESGGKYVCVDMVDAGVCLTPDDAREMAASLLKQASRIDGRSKLRGVK